MKNRLTPYETGWLSMLVARGIATGDEARAAMNRVAQAAVEEMERRRKRKARRAKRDRRKED